MKNKNNKSPKFRSTNNHRGIDTLKALSVAALAGLSTFGAQAYGTETLVPLDREIGTNENNTIILDQNGSIMTGAAAEIEIEIDTSRYENNTAQERLVVNDTTDDLTEDVNGVLFHELHESTSTATTGGGAIYIAGGKDKSTINIIADFVDNYVITSKESIDGGAIKLGKGASIGNIEGNFVGNHIESTANVKANGGAISIGDNGSEKSFGASAGYIKGNFSGNHAEGKGQVLGGAIYAARGSSIDYIDANFIGNGLSSSGDHVKGGALYFEQETTIDYIKGNFYNNEISAEATNKQASGGAIMFCGTTDYIEGDFEGNKAYSNGNLARGGAIYNPNGTIKQYINGNFTNNRAESNGGDAYGGAIFNSGTANTAKIEGSFSENSAEGKTARGGAIYNETSITTNSINSGFDGNSVTSTNGVAQGGALWNSGTITSIEGDFSNNEVTSNGTLTSGNTTWCTSGGAIYNSGTITSIEGYFSNNSVTSGSNVNAVGARLDTLGGAIYNSGTIDSIIGDFDDNTITSTSEVGSGTMGVQGGAIYVQDGKIGLIQGNFNRNSISTAQKDAQGGAVNVNANAEITTIIGNFNDNSMTSGTGFVRGGAVFIVNSSGNIGTLGSIIGDFNRNSAQALGISTNPETNDARGGAILIGGSLGSIHGDFIENHADAVGGEARGGAIYIPDGTVTDGFYGDFKGNYATTTKNTAQGGAIYNSNDIAIIAGKEGKRGLFENNHADGVTSYGGAIYNSVYGSKPSTTPGHIELIKADFTGNYATAEKNALGGAIYNTSEGNKTGATAYIGTIDGDFSSNSAISTVNGNAYGGAIYNTVQFKQFNSDFDGNSAIAANGAAYGGAIYNTGEIDGIVNGAFDSNYAEGSTTAQGGAIYNTNATTIRNSSFEDNYANATGSAGTAQGGAIYMAGGSLTIQANEKDLLFTGNHADSSDDGTAQGGAIYIEGGSLTINAENGNNILFEDNYVQNGDNRVNEAIYIKDGNLTLDVKNGSKITFHDKITGKENYLLNMTGDYNNGQNTSTIHLSQNVSQARATLGNAILELGISSESADPQTGMWTSDIFDDASLTVNSGKIDMRDNKYTEYLFNELHVKEGGNAEFYIDGVLGTQEQKSDKIVINKGGSGFVTIKALKIANTQALSEDEEYTLQIIKAKEEATSAPQLYLDEALKKAPIVSEHMLSTDILYDGLRTDKTDTENDSVTIWGWKDNLAAWAEMQYYKDDKGKDTTNLVTDKTFTFVETPENLHVLTRDIKTDKDFYGTNMSLIGNGEVTLDLNDKDFFGTLDNGQTVTIRDLDIINASKAATNNGTLNLDNVSMKASGDGIKLTNSNALNIEGKTTLAGTVTNTGKINITDAQATITKINSSKAQGTSAPVPAINIKNSSFDVNGSLSDTNLSVITDEDKTQSVVNIDATVSANDATTTTITNSEVAFKKTVSTNNANVNISDSEVTYKDAVSGSGMNTDVSGSTLTYESTVTSANAQTDITHSTVNFQDVVSGAGSSIDIDNNSTVVFSADINGNNRTLTADESSLTLAGDITGTNSTVTVQNKSDLHLTNNVNGSTIASANKVNNTMATSDATISNSTVHMSDGEYTNYEFNKLNGNGSTYTMDISLERNGDVLTKKNDSLTVGDGSGGKIRIDFNKSNIKANTLNNEEVQIIQIINAPTGAETSTQITFDDADKTKIKEIDAVWNNNNQLEAGYELYSNKTTNDSIRVAGWRDNLAAWAELDTTGTKTFNFVDASETAPNISNGKHILTRDVATDFYGSNMNLVGNGDIVLDLNNKDLFGTLDANQTVTVSDIQLINSTKTITNNGTLNFKSVKDASKLIKNTKDFNISGTSYIAGETIENTGNVNILKVGDTASTVYLDASITESGNVTLKDSTLILGRNRDDHGTNILATSDVKVSGNSIFNVTDSAYTNYNIKSLESNDNSRYVIDVKLTDSEQNSDKFIFSENSKGTIYIDDVSVNPDYVQDPTTVGQEHEYIVQVIKRAKGGITVPELNVSNAEVFEEASAYMNSNDILAEGFGLYSKETTNDSLTIRGWKDNLAAWAMLGVNDKEKGNKRFTIKNGKEHPLTRDIYTPYYEGEGGNHYLWGTDLGIIGETGAILNLQGHDLLKQLTSNQKMLISNLTLKNYDTDKAKNSVLDIANAGDFTLDSVTTFVGGETALPDTTIKLTNSGDKAKLTIKGTTTLAGEITNTSNMSVTTDTGANKTKFTLNGTLNGDNGVLDITSSEAKFNGIVNGDSANTTITSSNVTYSGTISGDNRVSTITSSSDVTYNGEITGDGGVITGDNSKITINGVISGSNRELSVTNKSKLYLKNDITGANSTVNVTNSDFWITKTDEVASPEQGQNAYKNVSLLKSTTTIKNSNVYLNDKKYTDYNIYTLKSEKGVYDKDGVQQSGNKYFIDMELSKTNSKSDRFIVDTSSTGEIFIGNINVKLANPKPEDEHEYILQIIKAKNDNIQLNYDKSKVLTDAVPYMTNEHILAKDFGLYTTKTKNDSIRLRGWMDNLAAWAELDTDKSKTFEFVNSADQDLTRNYLDGKEMKGKNLNIIGLGNTIYINGHNLLSNIKNGIKLSISNVKLIDVPEIHVFDDAVLTLDTVGLDSDSKITNDATLNLKGEMDINGTVTNNSVTNITGADTDVLGEINGDGKGTLNITDSTVDIYSTLKDQNITHTKSTTTLYDVDGFTNNSLKMNSGDFIISDLGLKTLRLNRLDLQSGNINVNSVDVNLTDKTMGRITSNGQGTYTDGTINVKNMVVKGDGATKYTNVHFADDYIAGSVKSDVEGKKVNGYIYEYDVTYARKANSITGANTGDFTFARRGFNDPIQVSPVAQLTGGYAGMLQVFDYSFEHADTFADLPHRTKQAMLNANKYAINEDTNYPVYINQLNSKGIWSRSFTSFESIPLKNGPKVSTILYGTMVGGDSELHYHKNGWTSAFTAYAAYNGSTQNYSGNHTYQNGGALGVTETFYKDHFYTALTASAGASVGDTNTMFGHEDFAMLMGGIASRSGYDWEFKDGKFMIQPTFLMSYTFINTFDYTNAAGVRVESDPFHALQIHPSVKFIINTENSWQPYLSAGFVYNVMGQTQFRANDVTLPSLSIKPYAEYGVGVQRFWNDKFAGYAQAMVRSGGRNGVALTFGFRWTLGKDTKEAKDLVHNPTKKISDTTRTYKKAVIKSLNYKSTI